VTVVSATESAAKLPFVKKMSSGEKGTLRRARSPSATVACASGSLPL
jgi:hypothetical protein